MSVTDLPPVSTESATGCSLPNPIAAATNETTNETTLSTSRASRHRHKEAEPTNTTASRMAQLHLMSLQNF